MRIFISAGEPSGDLHAANLARSLKARMPDAEIVGFGGEHLERAGAKVLFPLVQLAVMWFLRVLLNLHKFIGIVGLADRYFRDHRPDVVVLIDYPGLHWWIASKAKKRGIPVVFFVPPQIWAWAGWRVEKVRKYFDLVLCSLPFETDWYRARGVEQAEYIGHPYFDELKDRKLDEAFLLEQQEKGHPVIALLPGSRTQEVSRNTPMMLRAAKSVLERFPQARFVVSCLREKHAESIKQLVAAEGLPAEKVEVHHGRTPELIRVADLAFSVSGSVSLELMVEALPTVVVYRVNRFDLIIARPFIKSKFICLVNLLADREVMPEYLTSVDVAGELSSWAVRWLEDPQARGRASRVLAELRDVVAVPGATDRAAERILAIVTARHGKLAGPHRMTASAELSQRRQPGIS